MLKFLRFRPYSVLGLIAVLHTLAYAVGYILPTPGFKMTVLYTNVEEVIHPRLFGILVLLVAIYSGVSFLTEKSKAISLSSYMQACLWLFVSLIYFFNGFFYLGVAMGLCWSFLSGYINLVYKWRSDFTPERT